jgi:polyisoprenoid-binding protein YceI
MTAVQRPFPQPLAPTRWMLDASVSRVEFSVRQFWGLSTVHGRFDRFEGELELGANGAGRAELRIESASLETGNAAATGTCALPTTSTPNATRSCASPPPSWPRLAEGSR